MSRKAIVMFSLAGLAVVLYALRFVPSVAIGRDLSDFFGGMAIGLGIGATFTWLAERG